MGLVSAAIGALVLLGWWTGLRALTHLVTGFVSMRPNTALCLVLGGAAASLRTSARPGRAARRIARALAGAVAAVSAAALAQPFLGPELRVDQILASASALAAEVEPRRAPLLAAGATFLLGLALFGLEVESPRGRRPAQFLALAAGLVPLHALVSYAYGVEPRHGLSPFTQVAPHAGVGLALLAGSALLARPDRGLMTVISADGPGGRVMRRLLVPVVLLPLALGWLFLVFGPRLGKYEAVVGASFLVLSAIVTGSVILWRNAREVQRADDDRGRVEETLRAEREWLRRVEAERVVLLERERVARAEAERSSGAKDEFIATLSHELRTPLNSVLGWARLLRGGKLDEAEVRQAVEAIERGATTQAQLVDDLLDVSRIVRGVLRLDVRPVDLAAVIRAAAEVVEPAARGRDIEIAIRLAKVGAVAGDPGRLQQVVWNLLSNAIKFTPPGGRVEIRLAQAEAAGVEIAVSDSGKGITRDFLPHLFERFRQADSSTTRAHGGLGLGLAIVRHLVEAHGGTVEAESPGPGLGSTFTVRLPPAPTRPRSRSGEIALPGPAPDREA
jgi:signal transduction histidine kinase